MTLPGILGTSVSTKTVAQGGINISGSASEREIETNRGTGTLSINGTVPTPVVTAPPVVGYCSWFDASQIWGIADGAELAYWSDMSANKNGASVGAGTPTYYQSNALANGQPSVYLNGSSYLKTASLPTTSTNFTMFVVCRTTGFNDANAGAMVAYLGSGASNGGGIALPDNATEEGTPPSYAYAGILAGGVAWENSQDEIDVTTSTGGFYDDTSVYCMVSSSGTVQLWKNNGIMMSNAITPKTPTGAFYIGWDASHGKWTGYVSEVLLYPSALTNKQKEQVMNYLQAKWMLNLPLPYIDTEQGSIPVSPNPAAVNQPDSFAYWNALLNDNPTCAWRLNELSYWQYPLTYGTFDEDFTGNEHVLLSSSAFTLDQNFSSYLQTGLATSSVAQTTTTQWSLEASIEIEDNPSSTYYTTWRCILAVGTSSNGYAIGVGGPGGGAGLYLEALFGNVAWQATSSVKLGVNNANINSGAYHIVVTFNNGTLTYYINGSVVYKGTGITAPSAPTFTSVGFLNGSPGRNFCGYIYGAAVYSKELTSTQVIEHYDAWYGEGINLGEQVISITATGINSSFQDTGGAQVSVSGSANASWSVSTTSSGSIYVNGSGTEGFSQSISATTGNVQISGTASPYYQGGNVAANASILITASGVNSTWQATATTGSISINASGIGEFVQANPANGTISVSGVGTGVNPNVTAIGNIYITSGVSSFRPYIPSYKESVLQDGPSALWMCGDGQQNIWGNSQPNTLHDFVGHFDLVENGYNNTYNAFLVGDITAPFINPSTGQPDIFEANGLMPSNPLLGYVSFPGNNTQVEGGSGATSVTKDGFKNTGVPQTTTGSWSIELTMRGPGTLIDGWKCLLSIGDAKSGYAIGNNITGSLGNGSSTIQVILNGIETLAATNSNEVGAYSADHIVVTFNNGKLTYYVNGNVDKTITNLPTPSTPANGTYMGYQPNSTSDTSYSGDLQAVSVYPYALSNQQVLAHFKHWYYWEYIDFPGTGIGSISISSSSRPNLSGYGFGTISISAVSLVAQVKQITGAGTVNISKQAKSVSAEPVGVATGSVSISAT